MTMLKKISAMLLSAVLAFSLPFSAFADGELTKQSDGSYLLFDGSTLTGVTSRGVDVSHWQGTVDWKTASKNDVSFAMLGTRYQNAVDPNFAANAKGASENGVKIGIYLYSYAMTVQDASDEADFVLNLIKDYPVSYPVAYDVEDTNTQGTLSKSDLTAIIRTFCEKIRAAGYYPIIYANDYWLINKMDMNALSSYPVWVAAYQRMHNWSNPVMWQATSSGSIDGFSGNVDIDLQFKDFSDKIPANTWRQISGTWYYYQNYTMQKNALINDGTHTYYMNSDGTINKSGWFTLSGKKYYLDMTSGAAATGWKLSDGAWNYFDGNGVETKGWVNENGTWYYLGSDYVMKTGWLSDKGVWYMMGADGAMKTGWHKSGESWYYMDQSGAMQTGVINVNDVLYDLGADGQMYHDTTVEYNGKTWTIDGNGVMTEATAAAEETSGAAQESTAAVKESTASAESSPASETTSSPTSATVSPSGGPGTTNSTGASLVAPGSK